MSIARSPARLGSGLLIAAGLAWLVGYPLLLTLLEALGLPLRLTIDHFRAFAERSDEWVALWRSLWISIASVVLSAAIGLPLAFFFERNDFPGRRTLGALVALPVVLPPLVGVIAFLFLFGETGFVAHALQALFGWRQAPWRLQGPGAILLVHAYSMFVYFYLFARAGLARLDAAQLEAAEVLGAGRWRSLWRVVLPQLRPALLGAALLTFMTSLGSFSAPYIFGGGYRVMTTQIVASKVNGELELAKVEAIVLAVVALVALWLSRRFQGDDAASSGHGVAPRPRVIASPWRRVLLTVLASLLVAALLAPHATLLLLSLVPFGTWTTQALPPVLTLDNYQQLLSQPERLRPILNSLWMASVASAGAVALGLFAARKSLRLGGRLGGVLEGLIALPWAIPGTVFAVALAVAFSVDAPLLGRFVWVGTPIILPLAYLVRCLPITGRSALAGLRRLDPALEEAAASLGAGPWRTLVRVVLPVVRPALVAGLGLAFITALGDYVASIVLYTFETRPISIEIQSALRVQEFGVAAAYGVLLMAISALAFVLWGRGEER